MNENEIFALLQSWKEAADKIVGTGLYDEEEMLSELENHFANH